MKRLTLWGICLAGLVAADGCRANERQPSPATSLDTSVARSAPAPPADTTSGLHIGERPSNLFVKRLTPASEETGMAHYPVPPMSTPGAHARGDTLFADLRSVAEALGVDLRAERRGDTVDVDRVATDVAHHAHGSAMYIDVKSFARRFGAYTRVAGPERSGFLWPRHMLEYWWKNGPADSEVLLEARREGLLPP